MARKLALPLREREVCARFRAARVESGIRQSEMARRIDVNVNTLSSWEHGRNPIPYLSGARIARETSTCQRWLATGLPPKKHYLAVDDVVSLAVPSISLFSEVYDVILAPEITDAVRHSFKDLRRPVDEIEVQLFPGEAAIWAPPIEQLRSTLKACCVAVRVTGLMLDQKQLLALARETEALARKYESAAKRMPARSTPETIVARQREEVLRELMKRWERRTPQDRGRWKGQTPAEPHKTKTSRASKK